MGQTWVIPSGNTPGREHILKIGDATDMKDVGPLLAYLHTGAVVVTSPPYGMGQSYEDGYQGQEETFVKRGPKDHRGPDQMGGRPTEDSISKWLWLIRDFTATWAKVVHAAAINLADHTVAPEPGLRQAHLR